MWYTYIVQHIHNHSETHACIRAAVQRLALIFSAESTLRSVMRASGIIRFGLAGSFRLVGWLTLSCWLAAHTTTDWACSGQPVGRLIDYMHVCRGGLTGCWFAATFSLTDWEADWWAAGWLQRWLSGVYFIRPSLPWHLYSCTANTSHTSVIANTPLLPCTPCVKCAGGRTCFLFN